MSNNKQSSVDWLAEIIRFANKELYAEMFEEIEQAKAMHKEEIMDAYHINPLESKWQNEGIKYYKETFGGNND